MRTLIALSLTALWLLISAGAYSAAKHDGPTCGFRHLGCPAQSEVR